MKNSVKAIRDLNSLFIYNALNIILRNVYNKTICIFLDNLLIFC